jgi:hypothetical protein
MPPAGSTAADAAVFRDTVLWARGHGVLLGALKVGCLEATLSDPAAVVRVGQTATPESLLREYGGQSLADAVADMTGGDDVDE